MVPSLSILPFHPLSARPNNVRLLFAMSICIPYYSIAVNAIQSLCASRHLPQIFQFVRTRQWVWVSDCSLFVSEFICENYFNCTRREFSSSFFIYCCRLCAPSASPFHSEQTFFFHFVRVLLPFMLSPSLQIDDDDDDDNGDGGSGDLLKKWNLWKSEHKINVWKKRKKEKLHSRLHVLDWMDEWCSYLSRTTSTSTSTHIASTAIAANTIDSSESLCVTHKGSHSLRRHIHWPLSAFVKKNHIYFLSLLFFFFIYNIPTFHIYRPHIYIYILASLQTC